MMREAGRRAAPALPPPSDPVGRAAARGAFSFNGFS